MKTKVVNLNHEESIRAYREGRARLVNERMLGEDEGVPYPWPALAAFVARAAIRAFCAKNGLELVEASGVKGEEE